jgi:hypothetical protein
MAGSGTTALATDVNYPYDTGYNLMGQGYGSYGYGQTTFGSGVTTSTIITPNEYNNIRYDLLNASAHQNGTAAALSIAGASPGDLINSTNANAFVSYAGTVESNRMTAHSTRLGTSAQGGNSRTTSWSSRVTALVRLDFANTNEYRYFWNGGGQVKLSASRTGGAASAQNASWSSLLSSAGVQTFTWSTAYGGLNNLNKEVYSISPSSPYSGNRYTIFSSVDFEINTTKIYFIMDFRDDYVDPMPGAPPLPEDIVDGTLSYNLDIVYPTGGHGLSPSGTWTSYFPSNVLKTAPSGG